MSTAEAQSPLGWRDRAPLYVIAGSHGSLHWSLAIFYLLLPFIKDEYGMSYAEIGMLASIVHVCAFTFDTFFIGIVGAMNTLWHPAAISFLSSAYADRRGLALSFHTVGASIGDAAAPIAAGVMISIVGWQGTAAAGGAVPLPWRRSRRLEGGMAG